MDVSLGLLALVAVVCAGSALGRRPNFSVPLLLVVQGLSLPWLVRILGVRGPDMRADALSLAAWERLGRSELAVRTPSTRYVQLRLDMLGAERARVLELRRTGAYAHEVISEVLEMLDVEKSMLDAAPDEMGTQAATNTHLDTGMVPIEVGGCEHLRAVGEHPVPQRPECNDCVREGTTPVHLRMCLECENVGCCDSSVGLHAARHFEQTGHATMCSAEPRESWRWCYVDELLG